MIFLNTLIKNSFIFTAGIILSKALSLFFIFPFSRLVGALGMSLYSYAYVPFTVLLDLFSLGIPLGVEKLVAKYNARGMYAQSNRIFKKCLLMMIFLGFLGFLLMNIMAPLYSKTIGNNEVIEVIRYLSISLLIVPSLAILRGYFQANLKAYAVSISQLIEQLIRVLIIIASTYLIMNSHKEVIWAVKFSMLGTFFGALSALFFLIIIFRKQEFHQIGKILKIEYREILSVSLPFAFFGISFSLYQLIDSLSFNEALKIYGIADSDYYYGIYSFEVMKLLFIPLALITGLESSLLPLLIKNKEINDNQSLNRNISLAFSILLYFFIPLSFFMMLFSKNIYNLFYHNGGEDILFSSIILLPFMAANTLIISMMQGTNLEKYLYKTISGGIIFKALTCFLLITRFSYYGAIISTLGGIMITLFTNLYLLHKNKYIRYQFILNRFNRFTIIAIIGIIFLMIVKWFFPINEYSIFVNFIYLFFNFFVFASFYYFSLRRMWQS